MGQSQSSSSDTTAEPDQPLKKDYYELLSIERTATDDEIKKAYRRRALELHPDRNYGNEDGATRLFAEIQAAYEVLSDPQERAWYDSHRDVLLRGESVGGDAGVPGAGNFAYGSKMTGADDVLKLMMKFNSRVEFSDGPSGFYGGLKEFFETLAKEEDVAGQWEDVDTLEYPGFGNQEDDYEDVVKPFYAIWTGFSTAKSYAWMDKWKLSDAPDRRIRRLMEKENKKIRDEAVYEFNDAVRSLVAFVRKRDPRVQNNQKSEAERQKALKELAATQAARSRAQREAEMAKFDLPEWAKSREHEKDEHEGSFSSEEEKEQHEYECVVCDKVFKSEKQFQTHEKSKKHIKSLKELKRDMKREGKDLDLKQDTQTTELRPADEEDEKHSYLDDDASSLDKDDKVISEPPADGRPAQMPSNTATDSDEDDDVDSDYAPRAAVEQRLTRGVSASDSEDLETITSGLRGLNMTGTETGTPATSDADPEADSNEATSSERHRIGKAKLKRAKKAAAAVSSAPNTGPASGGSEFRCAVCQSDFPSKTKLFNHIKDKNHTAPISQTKNSATKGAKGKKR